MNERYRPLFGGAALAIALILAQGCPVRAAVVDSTANGFAVQQTAHIAAADAMLAEQLSRLKTYVETGAPDAKANRRSP